MRRYGEFFANFSLGMINKTDHSAGIISDIGIIGGVNVAAQAKVFKALQENLWVKI